MLVKGLEASERRATHLGPPILPLLTYSRRARPQVLVIFSDSTEPLFSAMPRPPLSPDLSPAPRLAKAMTYRREMMKTGEASAQ